MDGVYGTVKPALINSSECDIFYNYRPSRSIDTTDSLVFRKLDSNLITNTVLSTEDDTNLQSILPGMYNLRLPLETFGEVGIYTVYIKPKEVICNIVAVASLSTFENVKGIVLNLSQLSTLPTDNNSLVGYRIEYFNEDGTRSDITRIITSSNRCEPVSQNMNNGRSDNVSYAFNNSSNLVFCTVTPSTLMTFESNEKPWIGDVGQKIAIINTKFSPISLEIEITRHDIETLTTAMCGNQIRNLNKGLITTFNSNGDVFNQYKYGNIESPNNDIFHDFKFENENVIDMTEKDKYDEISEQVN